jgi:hypothetical protein
MAGEALFIGWGPVVRGREKAALRVFSEAVEYYGRLQQEGQIERFDVCLLSPHGGDLAGFITLYGERSKMAQFRFSDEFERMTVRAASIVDGLGVIPAWTGEAVAAQMARFDEAADEFGG